MSIEKSTGLTFCSIRYYLYIMNKCKWCLCEFNLDDKPKGWMARFEPTFSSNYALRA